eukprot:1138629-Pelagomonas_calceolata.AAC.4
MPSDGGVIATRPIEPNSDPPRKRKRCRHRTSITPVHPTHDLLLNTTQSNVLPPPLDVNPQARDDLNTRPRVAPRIRANLPGQQTELPESGPPSRRTCSTKRHNSISMSPHCSQGISGSSVNHNDTDCSSTEPDHFYTAATSLNGTLFIPPTHPNTPYSPNTQNGSQKPRKKRKKLLHIETVLTLLVVEGLGHQSFSYHPALFLVAGPVFSLCLPYFSQSALYGAAVIQTLLRCGPPSLMDVGTSERQNFRPLPSTH